MGDLRDRGRFLLHLPSGLGGLILPAIIFVFIDLNFTGGCPGAWGTAMSTDTAMALGRLSLISPGASPRLPKFLITVLVADDIGSLVVISAFLQRLRPRAFGRRGRGRVRLVLVATTDGDAVAAAGQRRLCRVAPDANERCRPDDQRPSARSQLPCLLPRARKPRTRISRHAVLSLTTIRISCPCRHCPTTGCTVPQRRTGAAIALFVSLLVVPLFVIANLGIPVDTTLLHRAFTGPITSGILCGLLVEQSGAGPSPVRLATSPPRRRAPRSVARRVG